jgi:DNA repair ATPase RecN
MPFRFKTSIQWSAIAIVGLVAAACGESKVAQCNRLIDVANTAVADVQNVTTAADPSDPEALNAIADTAESAVASMQELEFSDEQLQAYQQRFVQMYQDTSTASRAIYDAVQAENNDVAQQALNDLQTATGQETELVSEVNSYCGGTPQ